MLKDVGRLARAPHKSLNPREIANWNLAVQFGWMPLVKDVQDLLDLGTSIQRRKEELRRLYDGRGLRRRINVGNETATAELSGSCTVSPFTCGYTIKRTTTGKKWGVAHWKPITPPSYSPTDGELLKQARQFTSGLTPNGIIDGAWDIIPWSFIVDYFTDVHDFVLAYGNMVPAQYVPGTIMTHVRTTNLVSVSVPAGYGGGDGVIETESKSRTLGSFATVNAFLPNIGVKRLSILSSLFIQRFQR